MKKSSPLAVTRNAPRKGIVRWWLQSWVVRPISISREPPISSSGTQSSEVDCDIHVVLQVVHIFPMRTAFEHDMVFKICVHLNGQVFISYG